MWVSNSDFDSRRWHGPSDVARRVWILDMDRMIVSVSGERQLTRAPWRRMDLRAIGEMLT